MNDLVFDTSAIISIATNNLLDILEQLKKRFKGDFLISEAVRKEILDNPLNSKKYKLEAIMISNLIENNIFKIYSNINTESKTVRLLELCNNLFIVNGKAMKILDKAEVEALVLAQLLQGTYIVDERSIRLVVEDYKKLALLLERKLDSKIKVERLYNSMLEAYKDAGVKPFRNLIRRKIEQQKNDVVKFIKNNPGC